MSDKLYCFETHLYFDASYFENHASIKNAKHGQKRRKNLENTMFSRLSLAPRAGLEPATS